MTYNVLIFVIIWIIMLEVALFVIIIINDSLRQISFNLFTVTVTFFQFFFIFNVIGFDLYKHFSMYFINDDMLLYVCFGLLIILTIALLVKVNIIILNSNLRLYTVYIMVVFRFYISYVSHHFIWMMLFFGFRILVFILLGYLYNIYLVLDDTDLYLYKKFDFVYNFYNYFTKFYSFGGNENPMQVNSNSDNPDDYPQMDNFSKNNFPHKNNFFGWKKEIFPPNWGADDPFDFPSKKIIFYEFNECRIFTN
jgi:hypothetical protein